MEELFGLAATGFDLMLVVLGFGFIIFVHELGHFLAARWAGIRVLAFAIGFGSAAVSYRKGLGWRRGSSEREYEERMKAEATGATTVDGARATHHAISPTEYRINWLPFGGYVKMLGQDDANPMAVSDAPDSYQRCKPWKRMVVISAGVVMNLILAAVLFVGVFLYGLRTEPAKVGVVAPGMPASRAVAVGDVVRPGLKPGDEITSINGRRPNSFNDLILATAMTPKDGTLNLTVKRRGVDGVIDFVLKPEPGPISKLQEIGVEPSRSNQIVGATSRAKAKLIAEALAKRGLPGVEAGMRLVRVDDTAIATGADAEEAVRRSMGRPLAAVFEASDGRQVTVSIKPTAELQLGIVRRTQDSVIPVSHVLGLAPVLSVAPASESARDRQGLQDGDIFVRLGAVEFPGVADGIAEIKAHTGKEIPVTVLRLQADGSRKLVKLDPPPKVKANGTIGFERSDTGAESTLVAMPPARLIDSRHPGEGAPPAARSLITRPGTRIMAVAGVEVRNFTELREALRSATRTAYTSGLGTATVPMVLEMPRLPGSSASAETETVNWVLGSDDLAALHSLAWTSILSADLFETEQFKLQAAGPLHAMKMGLSETHRVMMSTYITFARLFQGTVKVEHLKGPVGIAHLGTRVAERGFVWLLFFMALISVNLAVINFLPLPIVDGGQFLFLVAEQIRGKPVPLAIQNAASIAGLLLIGAVFLIVTFHDIVGLFG
ncbi:MAG: site-2 protease family protein [Phycisphaeraceae bacterium]|nr:site-2 protease family protein [Phycisphaeraceae bacterium]